MRILQWETGIGVIERRIGPRNGVVTLAAERGWESRGDVVRNASAVSWRAIPSGLVAAVTISVG